MDPPSDTDTAREFLSCGSVPDTLDWLAEHPDAVLAALKTPPRLDLHSRTLIRTVEERLPSLHEPVVRACRLAMLELEPDIDASEKEPGLRHLFLSNIWCQFYHVVAHLEKKFGPVPASVVAPVPRTD